ncbi:hypothetical protein EK904_014447 [Melospiza melodia maxima]|nr:hypothetical protein EK904_014447 [Melospiza melodia maxima]
MQVCDFLQNFHCIHTEFQTAALPSGEINNKRLCSSTNRCCSRFSTESVCAHPNRRLCWAFGKQFCTLVGTNNLVCPVKSACPPGAVLGCHCCSSLCRLVTTAALSKCTQLSGWLLLKFKVEVAYHSEPACQGKGSKFGLDFACKRLMCLLGREG